MNLDYPEELDEEDLMHLRDCGYEPEQTIFSAGQRLAALEHRNAALTRALRIAVPALRESGCEVQAHLCEAAVTRHGGTVLCASKHHTTQTIKRNDP